MKAFWKITLMITIIVATHGYAKGQGIPDSLQISYDFKNGKFAAMPIVTFNRTVGALFGASAQFRYRLNKSDTISAASNTMFTGLVSTSLSSLGAVSQNFFFDKNKWRANIVGGIGNVAFQYFQYSPSVPNQDGSIQEGNQWVDYTTNVLFLNNSVHRRLYDDFLIGLNSSFMVVRTTFDEIDTTTGENRIDHSNLNGIGFSFHYDGRNDINYPTKGLSMHLRNFLYREAWGASSNFDKFIFKTTYFWGLNKQAKTVIVPRLYAEVAIGEVPFQGQAFIGRTDLRGYTQGKFRANQVYTIQVELRQHIYKKFGMIAFLGMGTAINKLRDIGEVDPVPSLGIGARYLVIKKDHINIGVDVAVGKDDWSIAFRIGETFGFN